MKNIVTEMKNLLVGINSRLEQAEDQISDQIRKQKIKSVILIKSVETTQSHQQKETGIQKYEGPLGQYQVSKHSYHGIPEGEREQRIENLFEKMTENYPNLVKKRDILAQKVQRVPNKMKPKRLTPRHIIIKMAKVKDKERILKEAREKQLVTYSGVPIRLSANFSTETFRLEGIGKKYSK